MELTQLRAVRELRDRGSIAAVAAAMQVTPSSVSQQLSALQRKLGVRLTRLDGRRTVLTEAGFALAAAAVEVEISLARAQRLMRTFGSDPSPITMSAFNSAAEAFGPLILADDSPFAPRLHLADEDVATADFPALTTKYDLVIAHRMAGADPWPTSVAVTPLLAESLDIAFRSGHRLADLAQVSPADVAGEKWVAVHEGFPLELAVRRIAGASGEEAEIAHRINDFGVAAAVIAATDHVALLPRHLWSRRHDIRLATFSGDLGFSLTRRIDVLYRPETIEKPGVAALLEQLQAWAQQLTER